jgi:hypothetical protein
MSEKELGEITKGFEVRQKILRKWIKGGTFIEKELLSFLSTQANYGKYLKKYGETLRSCVKFESNDLKGISNYCDILGEMFEETGELYNLQYKAYEEEVLKQMECILEKLKSSKQYFAQNSQKLVGELCTHTTLYNKNKTSYEKACREMENSIKELTKLSEIESIDYFVSLKERKQDCETNLKNALQITNTHKVDLIQCLEQNNSIRKNFNTQLQEMNCLFMQDLQVSFQSFYDLIFKTSIYLINYQSNIQQITQDYNENLTSIHFNVKQKFPILTQRT